MHRCHLSDINVLHNLLADVLKDTHSSVANAIASGISNCADLQALQLNVT